ncbi:hypothetical protein PC114_g25450 [Phytophthora cactorum]|nr:hypothetical protein PC114_g25450 [Phytophthora cactorum]
MPHWQPSGLEISCPRSGAMLEFAAYQASLVEKFSNASSSATTRIYSGTITGFYQANGRCKPPPRPGRTPLTDARRIVRAVKVNRFVSVAVVAARVTSDIGVNVSPEVVRARVRAAGLHGRSARKKPFLTRKHRRHRLRYAQEFLDWSEEK